MSQKHRLLRNQYLYFVKIIYNLDTSNKQSGNKSTENEFYSKRTSNIRGF